MKNGKKLTYEQKQVVNRNGLDANEWFYVKRIDASHFLIVNKTDNSTVVVDAAAGKGNK